MREICQETGVSVTEGKRIQRQQRYDRLKEEFNKLIKKLCTNNAFGTTSSSKREEDKDSRIRMLEKQLDEEKEEIAEKVELYKAQITKMRSNMDLFKETVNNLQKANSELQKKCDSQPNGQQMQ